MKYKALKVIQLDKQYEIDEWIHGAVIHPAMITKLVRCGVIAEVETREETENTDAKIDIVDNTGSKSKKSQKG